MDTLAETVNPTKLQSDMRKVASTTRKTGVAKKSIASLFKPADLREHFLYSRAMEAVLWGMPVVHFDRIYQALVQDVNGGMNEILYWSQPSGWKNQMLTPDPDAVYFIPFFDMKETGPVVLKIPPAHEGSIVGSINDCWQNALEDVGVTGVDAGKGGEYLIVPPGFTGYITDSYIPLRSNYYRGYAVLRSTVNGSDDADNAVSFGRQIELYPLSVASNRRPTIFTDAADVVFDPAVKYDVGFFQSLNRMIQYEPWLNRDKVMIDILKTIGIEKDKPFKPDLHTEEILDAAAHDARRWLDSHFENSFPRFYKDRQWVVAAPHGVIETMGTQFETANDYPVDERGLNYSYSFSSAKDMNAERFILFTLRDKLGEPLEGAMNYCLTIPPNVPVSKHWSIAVYDRKTHAFIRNVSHAGRSSQSPKLKKNADGSTDIFFGRTAPLGKEENWIPTAANGSFEVCARFFGAQKALIERMWSLRDIEKLKM